MAIGPIGKSWCNKWAPRPQRNWASGPDFLGWLTDPIQNGGGAMIDFGCYGANLITWMMKGERPVSVTAVTQQLKPDIYPKVDDESNNHRYLSLTRKASYRHRGIGLWAERTWKCMAKRVMPIPLMHSTCASGKMKKEKEVLFTAEPTQFPQNDPFAYLAAVVHGEIESDDDLSSLKTNMVVVEILDAARKSAKEGKVIYLKH